MRPQRSIPLLWALTIASLTVAPASSFSPRFAGNVIVEPIAHSHAKRLSTTLRCAVDDDSRDTARSLRPKSPSSMLAPLALATALIASPILSPGPLPAYAYEESDYASETVTTAVRNLREANGNADATFKAFENVAAIITEGKGVGGSLNYSGIKLNSAYVEDEDTTIYNPGLTLLTDSEKERILKAVVDNRKASLKTNVWTESNGYAFDFLKQKLDPLHMFELKGYLGILPFYSAAVYLAAIFVQRNLKEVFPLAYGICVFAVFAPILVLWVSGP